MKNSKTLLSLALLASAAFQASALPFAYDSANVPLAIPDLATTSSILVLSDSGVINDLNVYVNLTHTSDFDLRISLRHNDTATTVLLFNQLAGSGADFAGTIFDDEAATSISAGTGPFAGTFRGEGLLSAFDGQSLSGTWTLIVDDGAALDVGTLLAWGIRGDAASVAVPEGGFSAALLGLGLLGCVAGRRVFRHASAA
jgi:subtilisin-like proprotein convertase family protein